MSQGVSVLFFSNMAAVEMKNKETVDAIIVANKAGLTAYKAKLFIDCTGGWGPGSLGRSRLLIWEMIKGMYKKVLCVLLYQILILMNFH